MPKKHFTQLFEKAVTTQQGIFDKTQGKYIPSKQKVTLNEIQRNDLAVKYFLKAGLDYKGQSQCCYETLGKEVVANILIDVARITTGFLSTEMKLQGNISKSTETLLIVQRGSSTIQTAQGVLSLSTPIMMNCLVGVHWAGGVNAGIDLGIGFKLSYKPFDKVDDNKLSVNKSWEAEGDEEAKEKLNWENRVLNFDLKARAGAKIEGGYNYEHFYAEDVSPIPFADNEKGKVRATLDSLFASGSYKGAVKQRICEFMNKNPCYFTSVKYENMFGQHITVNQLRESLSKGLGKRPSYEVIEKIYSFLDCLNYWDEARHLKPIIPTSVRISTHHSEANAGLFAEAKMTVKVFLPIGNMEAGVDALKITGVYKSANVRYQTVYAATARTGQKTHVVMTQDTEIIYKNIEFTPLAIKASTLVGVKRFEKGKEFSKKTWFNRMTYISTTVFWDAMMIKEQLRPDYPPSSTTAFALLGTGVSFGGSFEIENLMEFYKLYDPIKKAFSDSDAEEYFTNVAASLELTLANLIDFFTSLFEQGNMLHDLVQANGVETILLEASFRIDNATISLRDTKSKKDGRMIILAPDTAKHLLEHKNRTLEAIRMRYRIQDEYRGDSTLFPLGFKIAGQGLRIALKKINRAGSEGIIDLITVWMDPNLGEGSSAYEKAVPQVTLFCQ